MHKDIQKAIDEFKRSLESQTDEEFPILFDSSCIPDDEILDDDLPDILKNQAV